MSHTLSILRRIWRRPSSHQWSRLERDLGTSALPSTLVAEDQPAGSDTEEMRHYLAAQTSQVV